MSIIFYRFNEDKKYWEWKREEHQEWKKSTEIKNNKRGREYLDLWVKRGWAKIIEYVRES